MLVGSAPSELKLGTTTVTGVRRGAGLIYDSDVAAFQKASGATQVGPLLALVDYLKAESLWDYARFFPMKSAQNAGSGSTVYGLGGLTSNNMTLVNSPTWGSDGLTFARASSQYGNAGDLFNGGDLYAAFEVSITASPPTAIEAFAGTAGSFTLWQRGDVANDLLSAPRTPTSGAGGVQYSSAPAITSERQTLAFLLADGAVPQFFQGTGKLGTTGPGITSTKDLSDDVYVGGVNGGPDIYFGALDGVMTCAFFLSGAGASPSDAQHAQIATLLNAL